MIDKIRERLREWDKYSQDGLISVMGVMSIINQVEAEGGWIPCSERLPEGDDDLENVEWVLCYGKNRDGEFKYEVSNYVHEIHCWMCSRIADVIAWQPLPEPYTPKADKSIEPEWKSSVMNHFMKGE